MLLPVYGSYTERIKITSKNLKVKFSGNFGERVQLRRNAGNERRSGGRESEEVTKRKSQK